MLLPVTVQLDHYSLCCYHATYCAVVYCCLCYHWVATCCAMMCCCPCHHHVAVMAALQLCCCSSCCNHTTCCAIGHCCILCCDVLAVCVTIPLLLWPYCHLSQCSHVAAYCVAIRWLHVVLQCSAACVTIMLPP